MYRTKIISKVIIASLFLACGWSAQAQTITEEQVTVIAPYSPTITKAQKIPEFPAAETNTNSKFKLEYYTNPKLMATHFELKDLQAARYVSPNNPKYKQNVIKAGFGLYTTPYAELFLNGKLNSNWTVGLHARHLSSKASVKDFGYSGFSQNGAEFWTKNIGKRKVVWLSGFYQRDAYHYYGFHPDDYLTQYVTPPDFDSLTAQTFSDAGLKFEVFSTQGQTKNGFKIDGQYRYFWDKFNNLENLVDLNGTFRRPIEFLGLKNQSVGVGLNTEVVVTNWKANTQPLNFVPQTNSIYSPQNFFHGKIDLRGFYNIAYDRFDFKAGAVLSVGLDSTSTIKVYPDFRVKATIISNVLDYFLQFDGKLMSPSYYSLTRENPFVAANVPMKYTSQTYRIKTGFNVNIAGIADVKLWGSKERLQNAAFFTSDTTSLYNNQYWLLYDDADRLQIGGDVEVNYKGVDFNFQLVYQDFTPDNERQAWYKPSWTSRVEASYWLYDNLMLSIEVQSRSKVWAKVGNTEQQLKGWMDIGAAANYHLNKQFSAFVQLNNLLSQQYQLWYNYPVKGFGAMAGVSYAF